MTPEKFLKKIDDWIEECSKWLEANRGNRKFDTVSTELWTLERVRKDFLTLTPPPTTLS